MTLNARLGRVLRGVRRWRQGTSGEPIPVDPELPDSDWRHLKSEIDKTVESRGGPVAARRRARIVGMTYATLSQAGRLSFLQHLASEYDRSDSIVDEAIEAVRSADGDPARRAAENELRAALTPPREALLRRFAGLDGGLPFLVEMREDLLPHRKNDPMLAGLDADLKRILTGWFDVALLQLERLTWDSPSSFLEKLIEYEAVHAVESWDDLKRRLAPDRRCYAFVHPGMPGEPLIFVEVALTKGMADSLGPLLAPVEDLDEATANFDPSAFDTAIFYSISNCHRGLAGITLGDFLIKSVVEELISELVDLKQFATLSPIPGFRTWLQGRAQAGHPLLAPGEEQHLTLPPDEAEAALSELVQRPQAPSDPADLEAARPILMRLAANYLANERRGARAADPVAHFHLANGARIERLNWLANSNQVGWERGLGMMVNYRYELKSIERNHDAYEIEGKATVDDAVTKLLDSKTKPSPEAD